MKTLFSFLGLLFLESIFAQIPQISYQDFGYEKQVSKVEIMLYDFKDKVVVDNQKEELIFNKEGNIASIKTTFFSNNPVVEEKYSYENNLLFNRKQFLNQQKEPVSTSLFGYNNQAKISEIQINEKEKKTICLFSYNDDNQINEVNKKFENSYQYEKFEYDENNQLWKKQLNYFEKDTVSFTSEDLIIENKLAADISSEKKYIKFYTYGENSNEISRLYIDKNKISNEFLNLCDLINDKNMSTSDFRKFILGIKDVKVITKETFLKNEFGDWLVNYYFDNLHSEITQYYFKKIIYADGTISGDSEFNIFKVNEVKSLAK